MNYLWCLFFFSSRDSTFTSVFILRYFPPIGQDANRQQGNLVSPSLSPILYSHLDVFVQKPSTNEFVLPKVVGLGSPPGNR